MITWEEKLRELQDSSRYADVILSLRHVKDLHPFVEWRLAELLKRAYPGLHSQPEKWGVSSGRIDLAAYVNTRCVLHYELIASASNNHVFRDTTSLLVSRADEKLAILIDSDVDKEVSDAFFAAIPNGEIEWVYLREVLLMERETQFIAELKSWISRAEFVAGSVSGTGFHCVISDHNLQIFKRYKLFYSRIEPPDRIRVYLSTNTGAIELASLQTEQSEGEISFELPWHQALSPAEYRLCATSDRGYRWSTWIRIPTLPPAPVLVLHKDAADFGETVGFEVRNFPGTRELTLYFHQKHTGQGVYSGTLLDNGALSAEFRVPSLHAFTALVAPGIHRVSASCLGCRADAYLNIRDSRKPDELIIEGRSFGSGSSWYSVRVSRIVAKTHCLRCHFEIANTSQSPLELQMATCRVQLPGNQNLIAVMSGLGEHKPLIEPGQSESFEKDFLVSDTGVLRLDDAPDPVNMQFITIMRASGMPLPVKCSTQIPLGVLHHILSSDTGEIT
jgi:hypothetical protein